MQQCKLPALENLNHSSRSAAFLFFEAAVRRFWLTDEDMGFDRFGRLLQAGQIPAPALGGDDSAGEEAGEDSEPGPRG